MRRPVWLRHHEQVRSLEGPSSSCRIVDRACPSVLSARRPPAPTGSQGAGELVAMQVANYLAGRTEHVLPPFAEAFAPARYWDAAFLSTLGGVSSRNGQL